jgi:general secretion pathway protein G
MRRKKRTLTLLEIMIVIVLIGLIGSVIGVNMKGSLDKGKAFKTEQAKQQIYDILMLEVARGMPIGEVLTKKEIVLAESGLVKNPRQFLKDGWGVPFDISIDGRSNDRFIVSSQKFNAYKQKRKEKLGRTSEELEEEEE